MIRTAVLQALYLTSALGVASPAQAANAPAKPATAGPTADTHGAATSRTVAVLSDRTRQLEQRTLEARLLREQALKVADELVPLREEIKVLKPEVDVLGDRFVAAKPSARNRTPEQTALYVQLQSELAGKDARLTDRSAALAVREEDGATLERRIAARLEEDRPLAGRLQDELAACPSASPDTPASTPGAAAQRPAPRSLARIRSDLDRERTVADELRAKIAYSTLTPGRNEPGNRGLHTSLDGCEARIARLEAELAQRQAELRTRPTNAARDTPQPAAHAAPEVVRARLAVADYELLVVEHALDRPDAAAQASRADLEIQKTRLTALVNALRASAPLTNPRP